MGVETLYTEYRKKSKGKPGQVGTEARLSSGGVEALGAAEKLVGGGEELQAIEGMLLKGVEKIVNRRRSASSGPSSTETRQRKSSDAGVLAGVAGLAGGALLAEKVAATTGTATQQVLNLSLVPQVRSASRPNTVGKEVAGLAGSAVLGAVAGAGAGYLFDKLEAKKAKRDKASNGDPSMLPPPSIGPPSTQPRQKTFLSELTRKEHVLIQHAAAAVLLREPEIMSVVGSVEAMITLLVTKKDSNSGFTEELFSVSLDILMKYEATESHHGVGPSTIKVPTFLDHCITALKAMDCTVEGILRIPGNKRLLKKVVHALNKAGKEGSGITVDLAEIDPLTLASIFKRFLRDLPDPILTGKLFRLFLAASHIKDVPKRKRAMHFAICLMPKSNRDVMEVVFLFLDWLSSFAHINLKVGNQMDLSNIARVMAPTLLRPTDRDPHPTELPAMIAAVLTLLEDQHILHEIPFELAKVLHIPLPPEKDSRTLIQKLAKIF